MSSIDVLGVCMGLFCVLSLKGSNLKHPVRTDNRDLGTCYCDTSQLLYYEKYRRSVMNMFEVTAPRDSHQSALFT